MKRNGRALLLAFAIAMGGTTRAGSAAAQPTGSATDDAAREEARRLFALGSDLFLAKRYDEALQALEQSYRLVPSPNSALVAARCLRDLGRLEDAAERFAEAGAQAEARVAAGDPRYEPTAEAARKEGAAVRANLSMLRVRVEGAPQGVMAETPVRRAAVRNGLAEMVHRPGRYEVRIVLPSGVVVTRAVELVAGRWTTIDVDATKAPPPAPTHSPEPARRSRPADEDGSSSRSGWTLPLAGVAGAIGIAGVGTFVGFGLSSRATYSDLEERCAPICGPADRPAAAEGERDAIIANVGLAVGIAGLTAGVILLFAGWSSDDAPRSALIDAAHGRVRF